MRETKQQRIDRLQSRVDELERQNTWLNNKFADADDILIDIWDEYKTKPEGKRKNSVIYAVGVYLGEVKE